MPDQPISLLFHPKDNPFLIPSGYGKIARYVTPLLLDMGYQVRLHCPVGHTQGTIKQEDENGREFDIWSGGDGPYGENIVPLHMQRLTVETQKPGVLLFMGDAAALNGIPAAMQQGIYLGAAWTATDWANPTPKQILDKHTPFLKVWSMSKWGDSVLRADGLQNLLPPVLFGVNTELWKPRDRAETPQLMASMGFREDTFNVYSSFANQFQRKGEYEMFLAVGEFHKRHPEAKIHFYVQSQIRRDWDLVGLAESLGVKDLCTFSNDYAHVMGDLTEPDLAAMMNTADCVLSLGFEGFGFQTAEAMSLNKPVIGMDAGATPELLGGRGILVPPATEYMLPGMIRRCLPSLEHVVQGLERVWRAKGQPGQPWSNAHAWVNDNLTWKHCGKALEANLQAVQDAIQSNPAYFTSEPGQLARELASQVVEGEIKG